jgi:hypothetical protein
MGMPHFLNGVKNEARDEVNRVDGMKKSPAIKPGFFCYQLATVYAGTIFVTAAAIAFVMSACLTVNKIALQGRSRRANLMRAHPIGRSRNAALQAQQAGIRTHAPTVRGAIIRIPLIS